MRYSQYALAKEECCQCDQPYVISTAKEYCQSCHKVEFTTTWSDYYTKQVGETLKAAKICEAGQAIIMDLIRPRLHPIKDERGRESAQQLISNIEAIIATNGQ